MDLMEKLARNVAETTYERLSERAVDAVKKVTLDTIGCMIAGMEETQKEASVFISWGGTPEAPVYLYGKKLPLPNAVFLNSCTSYATDFDAQITFHDLATTIPVAMTVGDYMGNCSGKDFITAIAVGEDLASRLNDSANYKARNWGDKYRLFCPGGTIVIFGAAAIAAKLMGQDYDALLNTLGLAYQRCGTTDAPACEKAECVRIQMGLTARNGVESALLSRAGIRGIRNVLQGQHGWYISFSQAEKDGDLNLNKITDQLGERYDIEKLHDIGLKVFPVCGTTAPGALAAIDLVEREHLDYKKIKRVVIETATQGHSITGHPLTYDLGDDPVPAEGKFSQPYIVANAFVRRGCKLEHFTKEALLEPDVVKLAHKVEPVAAADITGKSARLTVEMEDGTIYHVERSAAENPFRSLDTVEDKFREMVDFAPDVLPKERCEKIIETVGRLEELENISQLTELIYSV